MLVIGLALETGVFRNSVGLADDLGRLGDDSVGAGGEDERGDHEAHQADFHAGHRLGSETVWLIASLR